MAFLVPLAELGAEAGAVLLEGSEVGAAIGSFSGFIDSAITAGETFMATPSLSEAWTFGRSIGGIVGSASSIANVGSKAIEYGKKIKRKVEEVEDNYKGFLGRHGHKKIRRTGLTGNVPDNASNLNMTQSWGNNSGSGGMIYDGVLAGNVNMTSDGPTYTAPAVVNQTTTGNSDAYSETGNTSTGGNPGSAVQSSNSVTTNAADGSSGQSSSVANTNVYSNTSSGNASTGTTSKQSFWSTLKQYVGDVVGKVDQLTGLPNGLKP